MPVMGQIVAADVRQLAAQMVEVESYRTTTKEQDELHAFGYPVMRCALC